MRHTVGPRDAIFISGEHIGEVKDVEYLYYSSQLRAQAELARNTGKQHVIWTGKETRLSKKMEELAAKGVIKIERRDDLGPSR